MIVGEEKWAFDIGDSLTSVHLPFFCMAKENPIARIQKNIQGQ